MSKKPALAKLQWRDPHSGEINEFVLLEGATATIGRSSSNDIYVPEQHVSRQHAVINHRDGIFMITDMDSANGTFVNSERVTEPFPLMVGDEIILFVPALQFVSADETDLKRAAETGRLIMPKANKGQGCLIIANGPQEGQTISLMLDEITIGRATSKATWEIGLQDPSVSRPHARLTHTVETWLLNDLGSSNGTLVNNTVVPENGRILEDGDTISLGSSQLIFRSDMEAPSDSKPQ